MSDTAALLITAAFVATVFMIIYLIEHRARNRGPMFTGPASALARILAGLLGLALAAIAVFQASVTGGLTVIVPLVALALIAYSLGAGGLLADLQGPGPRTNGLPQPVEDAPHPGWARRLLRIVLILALGTAALAAAVYGGLWVRLHPESQLPCLIALVLGCGVLIAWRILSVLGPTR